MRLRPLVFTLGVSITLLAGIIGAVGAQCVTCDTNPGGNCVTVASGHGACTAAVYPDYFCKLACPGCPGTPCDGGGGGGGCGGGFSLTPLGNDQTVITFGMLIRSNAIASGRLFRQGETRILRGAATGGLRADEVIAKVRDTAGWSFLPLTLAYAFQNVNEIAMPVRFASTSGDGFSFASAGRGLTSRLQLQSRSNRFTVFARPNEVELGADDLLLMSVRIDGQPYILALRSETIARTSPNLTSRLNQLHESFRQSVDRSRPGAQPLIMRIPDC